MSAAKEFTAPGMAVRTAGILFIFVIVFTGLLSAAYLWTKPALEASAAEEKMKLINEVLPDGEYDNALLYTDHTLAQTIDFLKKQNEKYDTAMIYISDHGESLGEKGLYLHGVPYAIAPKVQVEVPMVMWFSPEYAQSFSLNTDCLRRRAALPATHDNLFHSVLGLLDVQTETYDRTMDLAATCRGNM